MRFRGRRASWFLAVTATGLAITSCGSTEPELVQAQAAVEPFEASACSGQFRVLELNHLVEVMEPERLFDANGSGAAIGDLDGDGWPDIVLGNLHGPVRIFWSQDGGSSFSAQEVSTRRTRAVQLIDYDGDGDIDIALAPGLEPPVVLENDRGSFNERAIPAVDAPAYSMVWLDPDRDGDLDLVTGAYDMEFGEVIAREFINDVSHGVWAYMQNDDGSFDATQLADESHALAMTTADLDADGTDEVVVGNDFGVPDYVFVWDDGWEIDEDAFSVTSANTMSFDLGDVDGDGTQDLYATDMVPFDDSNREFWSMMVGFEHDPPGPQLVENVLLDLGQDGNPNVAGQRGVDATGWSWSGRLADLDNDADLDLYVANGMVPSPMLLDLPGSELVEPNLAYENDGSGFFTRATEWGLELPASSRALATGDIDRDGDLDIVASTVGSPALVLRNELCAGGSIIVEPDIADSHTVGTRVVAVIETADGETRQERTIRSGSGYLAADEPSAHFGLGAAPSATVEVYWPDGTYSVVADVAAGARVIVERTAG